MTETTPKTDEEIAKMVQEGNTDSFGVLVERYEDKLKRYGHAFMADEDDVKDVIQDVFIKTYTNIMSFDVKRRFSPWIYRIAHNEFVDKVRHKSKTESVPIMDFDVLFPHLVEGESAEGEMQRKELSDYLGKCLDELGTKYKEPLLLYYYEGMDYKEIADVLKVPVSTVGIRLKRGRDKLEKIANKSRLNL